MRRLLVGLTFLFIAGGPVTVIADDSMDEAQDPEVVIKDNCRLEAEGAGIAADEMDDYIRQCIAQQKYWQEDNGSSDNSEDGSEDDNQGDNRQDDGSSGNESPEDDSQSDSWGSS